jgi:acyl-CoA hydrolase
VEVFVEEMYGQGREKALQAAFIFAALNENHRPKRIDYTLLN